MKNFIKVVKNRKYLSGRKKLHKLRTDSVIPVEDERPLARLDEIMLDRQEEMVKKYKSLRLYNIKKFAYGFALCTSLFTAIAAGANSNSKRLVDEYSKSIVYMDGTGHGYKDQETVFYTGDSTTCSSDGKYTDTDAGTEGELVKIVSYKSNLDRYSTKRVFTNHTDEYVNLESISPEEVDYYKELVDQHINELISSGKVKKSQMEAIEYYQNAPEEFKKMLVFKIVNYELSGKSLQRTSDLRLFVLCVVDTILFVALFSAYSRIGYERVDMYTIKEIAEHQRAQLKYDKYKRLRDAYTLCVEEYGEEETSKILTKKEIKTAKKNFTK